MLFTSTSSAAIAATLLLAAPSALAAQVEGTCLPLEAAGFLNSNALSPNATISCNGSPGQIKNFDRYWGRQAARDSQVVVQPTTAQDVATIVGLINEHTPDLDWTFVGGGHSQSKQGIMSRACLSSLMLYLRPAVNGSSSSGLVIDLNLMNKIEVIPKYKIYDGSTVEVVSFEGVRDGSRPDLRQPSRGRPSCTHRALPPLRSSTRWLTRAEASLRHACALSGWVSVASASHMR